MFTAHHGVDLDAIIFSYSSQSSPDLPQPKISITNLSKRWKTVADT